mmetsp:Transcript_26911/g.48546  ORF Transcript_26911/g.48546 Transcript_26911/m.48546 type:complete len:239 (-) Transcript_26911:1602-2318(-)
MPGIVLLLLDQSPRHGTVENVRLPAAALTAAAAACSPTTAAATAAFAACDLRSSLPNAAHPSHGGSSITKAFSCGPSLTFVQHKIPSLLAQRLPLFHARSFASVESPDANATVFPIIPKLVWQCPALSVQYRRPKVRHALFGGHDIVSFDDGIFVVKVWIKDVRGGKVRASTCRGGGVNYWYRRLVAVAFARLFGCIAIMISFQLPQGCSRHGIKSVERNFQRMELIIFGNGSVSPSQ